MEAKEFRKKIASGEFAKPTAGYCEGYVQANMFVIPKEYADSFEKFARENSKAMPVLEVIRDSYKSKTLAPGANLLNELPLYNIVENGVVTKTVKSIEDYYTPDLVFFLIGCSFTFETSLLKNNIPLRHVDMDVNVPMYSTSIKLKPVDMFRGDMVVSMRPVKKEQVADACVVTSHYPNMHGTPIQVGYPEMIGIKDINHPDYGDAVAINEDEIPLFWPCGVTPQNVLKEVKLPFAITHAPGHMFVSDKKDSDYYV
ncbi:MAG: putative hydro-lyase [Sulfurospirillaceae bacterium]|nr:putative hydro-lyase [Sulfurospirillaceae bacterium]